MAIYDCIMYFNEDLILDLRFNILDKYVDKFVIVEVKQVSDGQECGITVKDYMDFQKNDTIEAFSVTSTERSI